MGAIVSSLGGCRYRGFRLRPADAGLLLILVVRFGAARLLRAGLLRLEPDLMSVDGSGCESTGWGCVLRTASASIRYKSVLVSVEGFVI